MKPLLEFRLFRQTEIKSTVIGKGVPVAVNDLFFQNKGGCTIFAAAVIIVLIENRVLRIVARYKRGCKDFRKFAVTVAGFDPDGAPFVINADGTADGVFLIGTVKTDPVSS